MGTVCRGGSSPLDVNVPLHCCSVRFPGGNELANRRSVRGLGVLVYVFTLYV
jgi:hypothetical protein